MMVDGRLQSETYVVILKTQTTKFLIHALVIFEWLFFLDLSFWRLLYLHSEDKDCYLCLLPPTVHCIR